MELCNVFRGVFGFGKILYFGFGYQTEVCGDDVGRLIRFKSVSTFCMFYGCL